MLSQATTRTRIPFACIIAASAIAIFALGCNKPAPFKLAETKPRSDRPAPFDPPKNYPEWTYDKPSYMKAAADLQPEPRAREEDPLHYFTNKKLVPIRQPGGYKPEEIPRVAVWYTDNNGFDWQRAGYLGRIETYYWFDAPGDGDYGVRFVGPGQEPAKVPVAEPVRVYHVDTTLPDVELIVDPNQAWYQPGQSVVITWKAHDYHLKEQPVEIGLSTDFSSEHPSWTVLQKDLEAEGSYTYTIPNDAADHGLTFRVAALDRAGNLGMAFSHLIQVTGDKNTAPSDTHQTPPPQPLEMPTAAMAPPPAPPPLATPPTQADAAPAEVQIDGNAGSLQPDAGASIASPNDSPAPAPAPTGWTPMDAPAPSTIPQPSRATSDNSTKQNDPVVELQTHDSTPANTISSRQPDADVLFESKTTPPVEAAHAAESAPTPAPVSPPVIRKATVEPADTPPMASGDNGTADGAANNPNPSTTDLIPEMESKPDLASPAPRPVRSPTPAISPIAPIPTRTKTRSDRSNGSSNGAPSPHTLVPPLPATVGSDPHVATASQRPWQSLRSQDDSQPDVVWQLPRPAFMTNSADLFEMQLSGANRDLLPAAPGADTSRPLVTLDNFGKPKLLPPTPRPAP